MFDWAHVPLGGTASADLPDALARLAAILKKADGPLRDASEQLKGDDNQRIDVGCDFGLTDEELDELAWTLREELGEALREHTSTYDLRCAVLAILNSAAAWKTDTQDPRQTVDEGRS